MYYLRPRLYIRTYECLDGEQGLTADGLGTPFARAQPRLGKHPQHSLNARIVCVYCTEHEQFKYIDEGAPYFLRFSAVDTLSHFSFRISLLVDSKRRANVDKRVLLFGSSRYVIYCQLYK